MEFGTNLSCGTTVTFAGGSESGEGTVLFVTPGENGLYIVVDATPFHPESASWPDQPGDTGTLVLSGGQKLAVTNSLTGTLDPLSGSLFVGGEVPSQPADGATRNLVVIHVVEDNGVAKPELGAQVVLQVDSARRKALSLQHTAVHIASLALNQSASQFWTKEFANTDDLGSPNFDQAAISVSQITETASIDTYRIGKSLRKKGFDRDRFVSSLADRADEVNRLIVTLMEAPSSVSIEPASGSLDGRRIWSTILNGRNVSIPCGGTHVAILGEIAEIVVTLSETEDGFVMETKAR